ncbi:MAG: carbohydrate ABC transporter permease [Spirochaetaceae bacterium]|jgi:putative aldouronate transport system permease protein|nr:carbohydrate ABC transporter permease [Spirochaetaceae bacterium]
MVGGNKHSPVKNLMINGLFIILSLACVLPLVLIIAASLSTEEGINLRGYSLLPRNFSFQAYKYIFQSPKQLFYSYRITIFVTVTGSLASLLCTGMLAYVIARRDFLLRRFFSFLVLFTLLFSGGIVPTYIMVSRYYHLKDTILALIFPYIIIPWHVFLMKGFFSEMPTSLIEAAKIDGAMEGTIFFRIIVPISKPAFATVGLFCAFTYWNDWWLSLLYIDNARLISLQFYLYRIMNTIQFLATSMQTRSITIDLGDLPGETARMALCVLAAGPMLFIFPFFQKYFVRGLTMGAIKE